MSYRKFGKNDFFTNTMKAYPKVNFYIKSGDVYYNNTPRQEGVRNTAGSVRIPEFDTSESNQNLTDIRTVRNVDKGYINLYEYNIDRPLIKTDRIVGSWPQNNGEGEDFPTGAISYLARVQQYNNIEKPVDFVQDLGIIYPFITKQGAGAVWKTVSSTAYMTGFKYGDVLTASYPLSASITREYINSPYAGTASSDHNSHYTALRNRLDFYGARSPAYLVDSPYGNKDTLRMNLISIPSIFYGTKINPGSVSLKMYITGTLIGELKDHRQNGELIQTGPSGSVGSGSTAGVILYDEGFLLLTGSWNITTDNFGFTDDGLTNPPRWIYFAAGTHDGVTTSTADSTFTQASFAIDFKGSTETQVMTMFAHANRGEANYSNNPTFIEKGQVRNEYTSSYIFEQRKDIKIKNIVSSSYLEYNAPFKRQLYISRIGVYDQHKNLIGLATLSNPILKKDKDSISFKLKLDV